jgi:HSP20 family protein
VTQDTDAKNVPARIRPQGIADLREEMNRLWETVMSGPWRGFPSLARTQPMPAMDVFEKDGHLHIRAELPGMSEKDITVEMTGDAITISGEKKEEREVKEDNYYRSERSFGSFRRQVALPAGADASRVEAKFKDGVLEIDVPIDSTKNEPKKIEVKAAAI